MFVASLGAATALDLGLAPTFANAEDGADGRLMFGSLEPLVSMMQETPLEKILPLLAAKVSAGIDLRTLVASAALANARAFGGQDYTGYHTFMALAPALQMSRELSPERSPLPVFKVIYRNSSRIQVQAANNADAMHSLPIPAGKDSANPAALLESIRAADMTAAETSFARLVQASPTAAYNALQQAVEDEVDVHRVVLSWRAWVMLGLTGQEYAHALLRQSVRYCVDTEQRMNEKHYPKSEVRQTLPRLLDEHRLLSKPTGDRQPDDAWVDALAHTIFTSSRDQAAAATAAALAEGFAPEAIGESISLAANLLVLHDPGRRPEQTAPGKPVGCVHGDSVGVHASDAANAWRNIARVGDARTRVASLIVGAYHTAGQMERVTAKPFVDDQQLKQVTTDDSAALLHEAEEAIKANDQARACAIVQRYGELQLPSRPVFDLMLKYAVSEDGALHAEKYYRTVSEEFAATRPAFRWRQLAALARVTASEHGYPAPGYEEACQLLKTT
jgi:hypothetical protein